MNPSNVKAVYKVNELFINAFTPDYEDFRSFYFLKFG